MLYCAQCFVGLKCFTLISYTYSNWNSDAERIGLVFVPRSMVRWNHLEQEKTATEW